MLILQHTFASHFLIRGGNILVLLRIPGHTDRMMAMLILHSAIWTKPYFEPSWQHGLNDGMENKYKHDLHEILCLKTFGEAFEGYRVDDYDKMILEWAEIDLRLKSIN